MTRRSARSGSGALRGASEDGDERFGLSVFLRNGDDVFRTYFTSARGVDRLRADFNLLDLTPLGRQETWEDSPAGWPQGYGDYTRINGRPIAQWPRIEAGRSDDLTRPQTL